MKKFDYEQRGSKMEEKRLILNLDYIVNDYAGCF